MLSVNKMRKIKIFPEKYYKEIIKSIGSLFYRVFDQKETMPGNMFSRQMPMEHFCVVGCTSCTSTAYTIDLVAPKKIIIPAREEVVVVRLLRYDDAHGLPHYNADDQIIFPTKDGDILRLSRKDAPDHYINLIENANLKSIADAYKLPDEKSGPIEKYSSKGAQLHIKLLQKNENI